MITYVSLLGRVVNCTFFGLCTYSSISRGGTAHLCDFIAHIFVIVSEMFAHFSILTGNNERGHRPLVSKSWQKCWVIAADLGISPFSVLSFAIG